MINKINFKKLRYKFYILIFVCFFLFYYLLVSPTILPIIKNNYKSVNKLNLENHVKYLVGTEKERNYKEIGTLNIVGDYIFRHFKESGCDEVNFQVYKTRGNEYKNVICEFKGNIDKKIVIGAHYDVDSDNVFDGEKEKNNLYYAGADDNASGVAGILELSSMIGNNKENLTNDIEIVAFTLEEMPFYDSELMGSYVHAKSLYDKNIDIEYMISLEMIGFFSDEKIQKYPVGFLNWFYPSRGNFIAIIGKLFDFDIKNLKVNMIKNSDINVVSLSSPSFIRGVDFSDHKNYWNFGYKAYMITDTSFFRNKYYHTAEDTIDKLDFEKMKEVVNGVYGIIFNK